MAISKKERRFSIWIGIAIGVAVSSMLVRFALNKKTEQIKERPGNYKSLTTAVNGSPFAPIPNEITKHIPHGIVVYFEGNHTTGQKSWIIESAGSFRSERLFIEAKEMDVLGNNTEKNFNFHRASELYLLPCIGVSVEDFEKAIDSDKFKVIGKNSNTGEWILQVKDFSPNGLRNSIKLIREMNTFIAGVRMIPWKPSM
jgi:hypothetical protein